MKIFRKIHILFQYILYSIKLKHFGMHSYIESPLPIDNGENIEIGNNVMIRYKTWLAAWPVTGEKECHLRIGDRVAIGHFCHIYASKSIIIENDVLIADKVYISDNLHSYKDITIPVKDQAVVQNRAVVIGAGSWLGENVCILGAKIGKHCVVGANSVVTKDIPDYCVAAGIPARIIKRYNPKVAKWHKTNPDGSFIELNHKI